MTMSPLVISKALPPCHTERSEVSKNAESKKIFRLFQRLKMTRGRRKAQNDKGGTAQNDTHRDFSFATQTQNDNVFYDD